MALWFWSLCSSSPCHSSSGPVDEASIISTLVPARTIHHLLVTLVKHRVIHLLVVFVAFFFAVTPVYFDYLCCGSPLVLFSSTLGMIIHLILFFFCLLCFFSCRVFIVSYLHPLIILTTYFFPSKLLSIIHLL
ncbi:hypothetical protein BDA99DRAFT_131005 [Phascolomyces articulosus]|uniref:Uncharacterized protein n=1 Tax=Phascolomyces articulosus TaxID=60185 RepID=A0AAD5KBC3_9FUNG|nr:hypothetical protein BDA99DRAFT_131005 [Phascolomyces articulosus]